MHELYTALVRYYDAIYRRRVERIEKEIYFVEDSSGMMPNEK